MFHGHGVAIGRQHDGALRKIFDANIPARRRYTSSLHEAGFHRREYPLVHA
jgi:hypothetical protein